MKSVIHRVMARQPNAQDVSVDDVDISDDRALLDRYGLDIPVLFIDGKKVAEYRVSEQELERMLEARKG